MPGIPESKEIYGEFLNSIGVFFNIYSPTIIISNSSSSPVSSCVVLYDHVLLRFVRVERIPGLCGIWGE